MVAGDCLFPALPTRRSLRAKNGDDVLAPQYRGARAAGGIQRRVIKIRMPTAGTLQRRAQLWFEVGRFDIAEVHWIGLTEAGEIAQPHCRSRSGTRCSPAIGRSPPPYLIGSYTTRTSRTSKVGPYRLKDKRRAGLIQRPPRRKEVNTRIAN